MQAGLLRRTEGTNLAGDADDQGVVRDVTTHDGPGADEDVVAHVGVFQQHGIDAHQDVAAHLAAVDNGAVGEQHVVAQLQVVVGVQHAVVLQ